MSVRRLRILAGPGRLEQKHPFDLLATRPWQVNRGQFEPDVPTSHQFDHTP